MSRLPSGLARRLPDKDDVADRLYGLGWATVRTLPEPAARALGRSIADQTWKKHGKGVRQLEANLR
ncbi:lipid A biosynthesis acyltransferase, partial [Streptomyces sp. NRRL F-6602]